jgi:hypothetical protein
MAGTDNKPYYNLELITAVKIFIVQALGEE